MGERGGAPVEVESPARRRLFTTLAAGATAVAAAALGVPVVELALAPLSRPTGGEAPRVDLGPAASFDPVKDGSGGPREVVFPVTLQDGYMTRKLKERVYVVRDAGSPAGLAVLDTTCSHLGCGVSWSTEKKLFLCPCHGGVYTEEGKVVAGPPPRPLARLPFVVEGGRLSLDVSALA
jgi:Rieske Fe-S protein